MSVFNWTPDFGAEARYKPQVSAVKFGDGYEARAAKGLNYKPQSWSLTFNFRSDTETQEILDFLNERGGFESFDWVPPKQLETKRFVCREWSGSIDRATFNTVRCTFDEVFEP